MYQLTLFLFFAVPIGIVFLFVAGLIGMFSEMIRFERYMNEKYGPVKCKTSFDNTYPVKAAYLFGKPIAVLVGYTLGRTLRRLQQMVSVD